MTCDAGWWHALAHATVWLSQSKRGKKFRCRLDIEIKIGFYRRLQFKQSRRSSTCAACNLLALFLRAPKINYCFLYQTTKVLMKKKKLGWLSARAVQWNCRRKKCFQKIFSCAFSVHLSNRFRSPVQLFLSWTRTNKTTSSQCAINFIIGMVVLSSMYNEGRFIMKYILYRAVGSSLEFSPFSQFVVASRAKEEPKPMP